MRIVSLLCPVNGFIFLSSPQALIHRDQVGNSLAMREFLAYEEDAHIAFVKKAHVPRIDKVSQTPIVRWSIDR